MTVHVAESLDLEIAGEHVGQLFLRGWDGWGWLGVGVGTGSGLEEQQRRRTEGEERRWGKKLLMYREKLKKQTWALYWGTSSVYEGQGPGTFSGRLHQKYSTAEAPGPPPGLSGEMGAVTTLGSLETSETARTTKKLLEFLVD